MGHKELMCMAIGKVVHGQGGVERKVHDALKTGAPEGRSPGALLDGHRQLEGGWRVSPAAHR
jgi:hypothetical protein